jgi:FkbM family methyltransferase
MFLYKIYIKFFSNGLILLLANILNKNRNKKINIIDIGCYVGHFSSALNSKLKSCISKSFFYLIDPNYKVLESLKLLKINFSFHNIAIHSNNKKKLFYLNNFFESSGSSLNKITVNDKLWNFSRKIISLNLFKKNYSKLRVQCKTLDNFIKKHQIKKIDLLKFDTEGNELNILKGAKKALKKTRVIYFEILSQNFLFHKKFDKVNSILLNNNFFLYKKKRIKTVSFLSNLIAYDLIYLNRNNYKPTI